MTDSFDAKDLAKVHRGAYQAAYDASMDYLKDAAEDGLCDLTVKALCRFVIAVCDDPKGATPESVNALPGVTRVLLDYLMC